MKQEQKSRLILARETVAQRLVTSLQPSDPPNQAGDASGLVIRTDLKAGPLLLAAGLLGNGAAAGGALPS